MLRHRETNEKMLSQLKDNEKVGKFKKCDIKGDRANNVRRILYALEMAHNGKTLPEMHNFL